MPCAGVYPGLAEVIIGEYGPDIIIPAGGGMLGHPDGYTAGAQSWQQAIAAVMAGVPLPEARQAGKPAPAAGAGEVGLHGAAQDALAAAGARLSAQGDEVRQLGLATAWL